jgi:hypothetical protein
MFDKDGIKSEQPNWETFRTHIDLDSGWSFENALLFAAQFSPNTAFIELGLGVSSAFIQFNAILVSDCNPVNWLCMT